MTLIQKECPNSTDEEWLLCSWNDLKFLMLDAWMSGQLAVKGNLTLLPTSIIEYKLHEKLKALGAFYTEEQVKNERGL